MKPVAVIILNWNGDALLRRFLPSVLRHTPADIAEVIVADNGSTDSSLQTLREEFPRVQVIAFKENYGFAGGYNRALQRTARRYTVLLNSDVEVRGDWLTPLYRFMETHPVVAAVQPKIKSLAAPEHFEYAGAAGGYLDCHGYPYCRGRIFSDVEEDLGQYDEPVPVHWASGAALMVRTQDYLDAGGLDESFFAHMEEIDLCWRLRLMGRQVWAVPQGEVFHQGGASLSAGDPRKVYLNFRNSLLMLHKNLPARERGTFLIKRRLLDTLAWARMVAGLDIKGAAAIVRAHRDYRRMARSLPAATPQANLLQESAQGRVDILLERYLRGHKKYSDIGFRNGVG